jgi:hypothetical protein
MKKTILSSKYDYNPDHFRFKRRMDQSYDMVSDVTPPRSNRVLILLAVLVLLVFLVGAA